MPELPEAETVRRGLAPVLYRRSARRALVGSAGLRRPFPARFASRMRGRRFGELSRRGKYLLLELDGDEILLMHMGMSGRFSVLRRDDVVSSRREPHEHVRFELDDGTLVSYRDPRRFGLMELMRRSERETHPSLCRLGPEPLSRSLSASALSRRLAGRRSSIRSALLDQRVTAGLGNIYVAEILHRAGMSPHARADAAASSRSRMTRLHRAMRETLRDAIESGGSSLRDHIAPDGSLGYFQARFAVYGRADSDCPRRGCGGRIRRETHGGRSSYFCPRCQT